MKIDRMSKEDFIWCLEEIKKDIDYYDSIGDITREHERSDEILILPNSVCIAIDALEAAIGDKYDYNDRRKIYG